MYIEKHIQVIKKNIYIYDQTWGQQYFIFLFIFSTDTST